MSNILIIGATSAIAEHCGRIWAARGDQLYLVARNHEKIQEIAADFIVRGADEVHVHCMDLNNLDEHPNLLQKVEEVMCSIDTVLIAHGTLPDPILCQENIPYIMSEIQTNAISTISFLTLIAKIFEQRKRGTICVISSVAGDRGRASNYVYGSAKAMVTVFASGLRQRLQKSNVAVVTVKPGFVDTPMTSHFKKGFLWAKPRSIAARIVRSIDKGKSEVYVPAFWWIIMLLIKIIPDNIFKRLKI